tara:strand:- start:310 stop:567 length:258 start_codon:yes stop_codon:yes gene_type:complete
VLEALATSRSQLTTEAAQRGLQKGRKACHHQDGQADENSEIIMFELIIKYSVYTHFDKPFHKALHLTPNRLLLHHQGQGSPMAAS